MRRRDALAVGLCATLLLAGCHGDPPSPALSTAPTAAPSTSVPSCQPEVTDSGFNRQGQYFFYGLIVENHCPDAATYTHIKVFAADDAGRRLSDDASVPTADLFVILPGQRLGVTGILSLPADLAARTTKLQTTVAASMPRKADLFSDWPTSATAENIRYDAPDESGGRYVFFTLRYEPASTRPCRPIAEVILRDHAGRIVYGIAAEADPPAEAKVDIRPPAGTDLKRTEVYVTQRIGVYVPLDGSDPTGYCPR